MTSRQVSILVFVIGSLAIFLLANCKSSSNSRPVVLENASSIEPYGDLHLCEDFVYRTGDIPLKNDHNYELGNEGESLDSQRRRPAQKMPMRWERALAYPSNDRYETSDNLTVSAIKQSVIISP